MAIRKKITSTRTEEHYDSSPIATDLPLEPTGTNINGFNANEPNRQIETGNLLPLNDEDDTKNATKNYRATGKTYPDLFSEQLKNPSPEFVLPLFYIITFFICVGKWDGIESIKYSLIMGTFLSALWILIRFFRWAKNKYYPSQNNDQ